MALDATLLAFNRGLVSRLGLARVDVKRIASMSAEEMTNFIPRVLGSMSIRPGWKYLGSTRGNLAAKLIPFVFAVDDTAIIELTTSNMRVWRIDALITRPTVGTGLTNGTFGTDLTGWTDSDEAGATSSWLTGGYMQLLGDGTNAAIRDQQVTVSGGDIGIEHALTIEIAKGPVRIMVGTSAGGETYIADTSLGTGSHSLSFTPTGNFYIRFLSKLSRPVLVDSVAVEAGGVMTVSAPWSAANLDLVRWDQSADIVFVACAGVQPRQIERRSATSWSIVKYEPLDGPFLTENTSTITLTPSAITGSITLTASKALFRSTNVGSLYSMTSEGQTVTRNISAADTWTDAIRITGVDSSRVFTIILSGTWSATVTLQRSLDSEDGPWEDVTTVTWTANTTETFDDGLDNQIAWYRIGIKTAQYTSGTLVATLDYALGSITGVVRITAYTSTTSVTADVLIDLGGTDATEVWAEGAWSDRRGWPTAVALHEGRLWWAGKSKIWGSVSDAYDSFDPDYEGDAGPINRTLGVGPVDRINWIFSSNRLLLGGDLNEYSVRSSSLDEPITPTAFSVKASSSQGSATIMPGRIDSKAVFVNRTGMKAFELGQGQGSEYAATDLCQLVPEIGDPEIVRMAVQRQPDTRIHCIRSDGTAALAVIDRAEDVLGWCEIETDGEVEDVAVLPAQAGDQDDYIYYVVKRNIDGADVRYVEVWGQSADTIGGTGLGEPSEYSSFLLFEASLTDAGTLTRDSLMMLNSPLTGELISIGAGGSTDIWIHDKDPFTTTPVQVSATTPLLDYEKAGAISREGAYLWLSGDNTGTTSPVPNVRVMDISTHVVTDMGIGVGSSWNIIAAATEVPEVRVWICGPSTMRMYKPNIGTGSLGSAFWTLSDAFIDFLQSTFPATWDSNGHLWTFTAAYVVQINSDTGAYAKHSYPVVAHSACCPIKYDSNSNLLYVSVYGGGSSPVYVYTYSGWNTTPTADSGTWTLILTFPAPGGFYGFWFDYSAADDILYVCHRLDAIADSGEVYRYYGTPKTRLDKIFTSTADGNAEIYPYAVTPYALLFEGNYGYVAATGIDDSVNYLLKINYNGPELLFDEDGNSLLAGGSAGRINVLADSYKTYTGVPTTTITGLSHLEGESVVVWANGVDLGTDDDYAQTFTVASGSITLPAENTNVTVGLPYQARFKSAKLGLQTQNAVLFGKEKRITELALILADTHAKGLRFGPDFTHLDDRPGRDEWADVDPDNIDTAYDQDMIAFPSTWTSDLRVCLQAQAPRPCTVLAIQLTIEV